MAEPGAAAAPEATEAVWRETLARFFVTWVATFLVAVLSGYVVERVIRPAPLGLASNALSFGSSALAAAVAVAVSFGLWRSAGVTSGGGRWAAVYATALALFIGGSWPFAFAVGLILTRVQASADLGGMFLLGAVGSAAALCAAGTQFMWRLGARDRAALRRPATIAALLAVAGLLVVAAASRSVAIAAQALHLPEVFGSGTPDPGEAQGIAWGIGLNTVLAVAALWGTFGAVLGFVRGVSAEGDEPPSPVVEEGADA